MGQRLAGKTAIVTGSGQGIGKGIALYLAREGADIVVAEYNEETAVTTAAEIEGSGRERPGLSPRYIRCTLGAQNGG